MTSGERAKEKEPSAEQQPDGDDAQPESAEEGFFPKAQQLGAQAFSDGTKVMENASSFVHTVNQISQEAGSSLSDSMKNQPYLVLGAAATAGFVLGRGLTFGMSRTLLGMGGKLAMSMLVKRVTASVF